MPGAKPSRRSESQRSNEGSLSSKEDPHLLKDRDEQLMVPDGIEPVPHLCLGGRLAGGGLGGEPEAPQDMRRQLLFPPRQMQLGRVFEPTTQGIVTDPARGAVGVLELGGEQRGAGTGVIVIELAPDILDEPPQRAVGAIDQRHHALTWPGSTGALAVTDVELAEAAHVPLDVVQVEPARLAHPQADLDSSFKAV